MSIATDPFAPPTSSLNRTISLLTMLVVAAGSVAILFPTSLALIVSQLLIDGPLLLAWLGACWGIGLTISRIARLNVASAGVESSVVLPAVTHCAIGIGVMSLSVLLLGSLGVLNQVVAITLLVAGNAASITRLYTHQTAIGSWFRRPAIRAWPLIAAIPIVAAMFVGALVIPSILWGDEPHAYDVVSYHLQLPREWFDAGRIVATPHNVFGYFPLNVEMHYLLAMTLHGGATGGMYLAQLMHAAMALLTLGAVYGAVRRTDDGRSIFRASVAVVLMAAFPWVLMLGSVAYNECGVMLFTTLAVTWAMRKRWLLAGLCAGFAAGCKITAVPALIVLLPAIVLVESLLRRRFEWRGVVLFLLGSMLTLAPWLIRTTILAEGNPIFPIAATSFGSAYFDAGMVERFEIAHAARPDQQTVRGRLAALNEQVFRDFKYGSLSFGTAGVPLLLLLIVPALILNRREQSTWILFAFIVGNVTIWLFATHLQGRFLVPIIPMAAILIAGVTVRGWSGVVLLVSMLSVPFSFGTVYQRLTAAQSGIAFPDPSLFLPEPLVNLLLQSDRPVYLVGDARAFLYPIPSARLHYRTVFDVSSTKPFGEAWLGTSPASDAIVVVVPSELERFEKTYRNLPKMPDEWRGRPMFVTDVAFKSFAPAE